MIRIPRGGAYRLFVSVSPRMSHPTFTCFTLDGATFMHGLYKPQFLLWDILNTIYHDHTQTLWESFMTCVSKVDIDPSVLHTSEIHCWSPCRYMPRSECVARPSLVPPNHNRNRSFIMFKLNNDNSEHCIPFILRHLHLLREETQHGQRVSPLFIGINGIQGAGKTMLVRFCQVSYIMENPRI